MFCENIDTRNKKLNGLYNKTTTFYRYDPTSTPLSEATQIQLCGTNSYSGKYVPKDNFCYNDHREQNLGFAKVGYYSSKQSNTKMPKNYNMTNYGIVDHSSNSATKNNCLIISKKLIVENGETVLVETCRKVAKNSVSRCTKFKKISKSSQVKPHEIDMSE